MHRNPALVRLGASPIAEIQNRARRMRDSGTPLIDFSIGDPREPTPRFIREALVSAVPEISQYPTTRGLSSLRQEIAGYIRRRTGVTVDPETQVLPTSGSKEAIFSTALAFVDPAAGQSVVWPTPGYPIYERGAAMAGAEGVPIPLSGDFVLRPNMIPEAVFDRAAIVWLCSPHNPAGSITPPEVMTAFIDRCRSVDALLCVDECYLDLYDGHPPTSVLERAGEGSPGVLSYMSLSKRSGMTGYRSGAVIGDAEAISALTALRTSTGTAPPEFTQSAAVAAWSDDSHVEERRHLFTEKRAVIRGAFEQAGWTVVGSQAGIYVWVQVDDDLIATEKLLEQRVVVSPGRVFGPGGEGYLRLALVPPLGECYDAAKKVIGCLESNV